MYQIASIHLDWKYNQELNCVSLVTHYRIPFPTPCRQYCRDCRSSAYRLRRKLWGWFM